MTQYIKSLIESLKYIMSEKTRIFVYGSLLEGLGNHGFLVDQELVSEATTKASYTLIDLGSFPGLLEGGNTAVKGELYDVTESGMRRVNGLEGVDEDYPKRGLYRRENIEMDDGSVAIGYIYNNRTVGLSRFEINDMSEEDEEEEITGKVDSGNWREYLAEKRGSWLKKSI